MITFYNVIERVVFMWKSYWGIFLVLFLLNYGYAHQSNKLVMNAPLVYVNTGIVKNINVPETINSVGLLSPIKQVNLSFDNAGKLKKKFFKNGDRVLAGETIASLDDQKDMASLKSLKAKLDLAKLTYSRVKPLGKSGAISQEDIDQKFSDLQQAQAEFDQQQYVVERDKLKVPFNGVLSDYKFDIGSFIAQGVAVVKLTQENPLKIKYSVQAKLKPKLSIGDEVELKTDTYPNKIFKGKVNYISPTINDKSGNFQIEAEVSNDDYLLTPGLFMSVSQILKKNRLLLVVPDMAIQTNQKGTFLYVINPDDTVKQTYVEVVIIRDGWTQIKRGTKSKISEGTPIVVIGGNKLVDGQKIKVSNILPPKFSTNNKKVKKSSSAHLIIS